MIAIPTSSGPHAWESALCILSRAGCPFSEVVLVCPLLGGLSSFGVSFIGGFTVIIGCVDKFIKYSEKERGG